MWTPVFYDVVSNSSAIILSARLRSSNLLHFLCLLLVPVESLVLQIASMFTFLNHPRSARSFLSKFICLTLEEKSPLIFAACSDRTEAL